MLKNKSYVLNITVKKLVSRVHIAGLLHDGNLILFGEKGCVLGGAAILQSEDDNSNGEH